MQEELGGLVTEERNESSLAIDSLPAAEMLRIINREDQKVASSVAEHIETIATVLDRIAERITRGGRLFYIGAGTSGRLGVLDAAECPPTFGVPPGLVTGVIAGGPAALASATEASEDDPAAGARDLASAGFDSGDVLIGIAASGRTPYVLGAIAAAKSAGALTVALTCVSGSPLGRAADLAMEVPVGPEVITGSTRMKAGTATKLVLNMISTGLMIRLGYTFGNLMVNVQPRNEKLRDRATRIVAESTGLEYPRAKDLLASAGDVKTAIVMSRLGLTREEAEGCLLRHRGVLAEVLRG
jgi:N-acetylmuramic acid 6-phosphate etherase